MAALIMVNSGLILSGGRFCYGKDGLFFKQATELNKNQVPAKALWVQCIWACALYFGVRGFINVRNFCIVVVLYPNYFGCIYS
jgi:amino acid transporter